MSIEVDITEDRFHISQEQHSDSLLDRALLYVLIFLTILYIGTMLLISPNLIKGKNIDITLYYLLFLSTPLVAVIVYLGFITIIRLLSTQFEFITKKNLSSYLYILTFFCFFPAIGFLKQILNQYLPDVYLINIITISIFAFLFGQYQNTTAENRKAIQVDYDGQSSVITYQECIPILGWRDVEETSYHLQSIQQGYTIPTWDHDKLVTTPVIPRENIFNSTLEDTSLSLSVVLQLSETKEIVVLELLRKIPMERLLDISQRLELELGIRYTEKVL